MSDALINLQFPKLPPWVQAKIKELGVGDAENWIKRSIPALNNRSVLETLNAPDGEQTLKEYFAKVMGKF